MARIADMAEETRRSVPAGVQAGLWGADWNSLDGCQRGEIYPPVKVSCPSSDTHGSVLGMACGGAYRDSVCGLQRFGVTSRVWLPRKNATPIRSFTFGIPRCRESGRPAATPGCCVRRQTGFLLRFRGGYRRGHAYLSGTRRARDGHRRRVAGDGPPGSTSLAAISAGTGLCHRVFRLLVCGHPRGADCPTGPQPLELDRRDDRRSRGPRAHLEHGAPS
jgi:hypothetical protein